MDRIMGARSGPLAQRLEQRTHNLLSPAEASLSPLMYSKYYQWFPRHDHQPKLSSISVGSPQKSPQSFRPEARPRLPVLCMLVNFHCTGGGAPGGPEKPHPLIIRFV